MATIGWDESVPSDTESAGLGDDRIRSLKTSLRQGLDDEHDWPSAGGDAGKHRRGSAKVYVGSQSAVSSSGTDGKLMHASDTSRLFGVGSGGTTLIGGPRVIQAADFPGAVPQRHAWVEEFGIATTGAPNGAGSSSTVGITFPNSGFSGIPYVFVQPSFYTYLGGNIANFSVVTQDGASCIVECSAGTRTFAWRSLGTRLL